VSIATSPQQTSPSRRGLDASTGAALRLVGPSVDEEHVRHRDRNAFREEEHELQGHALALESTCLRGRAGRYTDAIDRGAVLTDEQIHAVLRAFRAYRPFVGADVRVLNDAARLRLTRAVAAARSRSATTGATDASVA
jgi:hypothetical protein